MNKKITFMLDMDGVCCDWVKAGLKSVGKEELIGTWRNGAKDLGQLTGLSYAEIWEKIDAEGSNWWRTLEEYSWFWELYNKLKERGDVVFCTSPSWDPNCHKGKLEWLHDRFGRSFRDYIFTNRKFYVAKDNTILIDDNDQQCEDFVAHGGKAVLFPQLWNKTHGNPYAQFEKVRYVMDVLKEQL